MSGKATINAAHYTYNGPRSYGDVSPRPSVCLEVEFEVGSARDALNALEIAIADVKRQIGEVS